MHVSEHTQRTRISRRIGAIAESATLAVDARAKELLGELGYAVTHDEEGRAVDATHPAGRTALFVNWGYTESIEGWWP